MLERDEKYRANIRKLAVMALEATYIGIDKDTFAMTMSVASWIMFKRMIGPGSEEERQIAQDVDTALHEDAEIRKEARENAKKFIERHTEKPEADVSIN